MSQATGHSVGSTLDTTVPEQLTHRNAVLRGCTGSRAGFSCLTPSVPSLDPTAAIYLAAAKTYVVGHVGHHVGHVGNCEVERTESWFGDCDRSPHPRINRHDDIPTTDQGNSR